MEDDEDKFDRTDRKQIRIPVFSLIKQSIRHLQGM